MSNFVFSRRALQRSINRLSATLERRQLASIADRLNRPGDARLPAMWELVLLDALAQVGSLRHEGQLPNGRRPDFELTATTSNGEGLLIVGDVATVSDAGLNEQNPVKDLGAELSRLAIKAGLDPHHFGYDVRGGRVGPYGDARVKLFLPAKAQLLALMGKEVTPWIRRLTRSPQQPDRFEYVAPGVVFSLTYDPKQRYARGGYLCYDVAASLDKNPLFGALKGKVKQLRHAPPEAIRLIVACDGGTALLRDYKLYSSGTFNARDVATDFLRQNSSIDAVLLVAVDEQRRPLENRTTYQMKYDWVVAPPHTRSPRMSAGAIAALDGVLRGAVMHVPQPVRSAYNAAIQCRKPGCGPDMIGGYTMDNGRISLSSRALQRLLAGELTVDEFVAAHGWNDKPGTGNPFARMSRAGRMISKIDLDGAEDKDDDWLTFNFGPPDPAAARFFLPDGPAPAAGSDD